MDAERKQTLADLRDLVILSERGIEKALGGVLPLAARQELSSALGRAFEIGAAYGRIVVLRDPPSEQRITAPPPPNYEEDYTPPPTPFLGSGGKRKKRRSNGAL